MPMFTRVGGVWRQVSNTGLHVRVGGTWRMVQNGYVRVGGVWRQFHVADHVNLTNAELSVMGPGPASAGFTLQRKGSLLYSGNGSPPNPSDQWYTTHAISNIGDSYQARLTVLFGNPPNNVGAPAINTWHTINTNLTWSLGYDFDVEDFAEWQLDIRDIATATIQDTAVFQVFVSIIGT